MYWYRSTWGFGRAECSNASVVDKTHEHKYFESREPVDPTTHHPIYLPTAYLGWSPSRRFSPRGQASDAVLVAVLRRAAGGRLAYDVEVDMKPQPEYLVGVVVRVGLVRVGLVVRVRG